MKNFKYISSMMFLIAFAILFNFSAFAGTWKQDTTGWWYQSDDGSYPKGNWKQVDNTWYYFDANGYMKTGWIQSGDKWYYCNLNGSLATNCWIGEYYVGADGGMYVNKTTPDGYKVGNDGMCIKEEKDILDGYVFEGKCCFMPNLSDNGRYDVTDKGNGTYELTVSA